MTMRALIISTLAAALLWGVAALLPPKALAASCCGGGSSTLSLLPRLFWSRAEISFEAEIYDGFWNQDAKRVNDPPGSDLRQYRLNLGVAQRINRRWQFSANIPYAWNENRYANLSSSKSGVGDVSLALWWGSPGGGVHLGPALTIPTGISPYDEVDSSFSVTGRGFYRLDGNLLLQESLGSWDLSLLLAYGVYMPREVNREYGRYVEPYAKRLGDRLFASASAAYTFPVGQAVVATPSLALSSFREEKGTIDGRTDPTSGQGKTSLTGALSVTTWDRLWTFKASWAAALRREGAGRNFPITDLYSLGVSRGFR